ncbi:MAG TPA: NYN domain-containing protein [Polyangiales bacterium]|nr:NYN domain-containing protein [Polyangiales bacterium]
MGDRDSTEPNLAVFCDYENVALGAKDASYAAFDIQLVIERLLDKGKVVVKKAYADWSRYEAAKRPLHEAAFELIEIPHVSYSGKNSADIRLVVDALDLCYAKSHVGVFVVVSGDSDFSPLVSKLRENDKRVIGVGVKNSSSKLLIENCDEFIYYDDLVREQRKRIDRDHKPARASRQRKAAKKPSEPQSAKETEGLKEEALDHVLATAEALFRDRDSRLFGSEIKQTLKRKRPEFSEVFHGYRNFNELLEDAQRRGLLQLQKHEPSGGYIVVGLEEDA